MQENLQNENIPFSYYLHEAPEDDEEGMEKRGKTELKTMTTTTTKIAPRRSVSERGDVSITSAVVEMERV